MLTTKIAKQATDFAYKDNFFGFDSINTTMKQCFHYYKGMPIFLLSDSTASYLSVCLYKNLKSVK